MTYTPRNRNERTREAPKATARWFDDLADSKRHSSGPCGFAVPDKDER